jgi:hypothetical protein
MIFGRKRARRRKDNFITKVNRQRESDSHGVIKAGLKRQCRWCIQLRARHEAKRGAWLEFKSVLCPALPRSLCVYIKEIIMARLS